MKSPFRHCSDTRPALGPVTQAHHRSPRIDRGRKVAGQKGADGPGARAPEHPSRPGGEGKRQMLEQLWPQLMHQQV